jgi:crotonobetainyl-CoA:carnitine CoA-transferase CaiB-like acyl-CoA transferase
VKPFQPDAKGPLDGIVVLDLTRLVAGNMLSLQLADFGAEVVKIEEPGKGDPLRDWRVKGISAYWKVYARNKKSVTLNLREAEGRELLLELARTAHVLIENFRPGTLEKMGLGPAVLLERNPAIVVVRISGWGQDGPYRFRPGFGTLVEGMSGFAARNGFEDREPVLPPLALADMIAGLYGAFAVVTAVRHAERGGTGQVIDLPLLDPMFSVLGPEAAIYQLTHAIRPRTGSRSSTASPRNVFRTSDGHWISMSASMQAMVERLYKALGVAHMLEDPRFRTNAERVAHAEEAEAPIRAFIAKHTLEDAMAFFEENEITAAPVYDIGQFMDDPHVRAREIVVEVPDKDMGSIPMHAVVPRLSATPGAIRHAAPELGEHTAEVLGRLGVDPARQQDLMRRRII